MESSSLLMETTTTKSSESRSLVHHYRHLSRRRSSLNWCLPELFERASGRWWRPQFDSPILEEQYLLSTVSRTTRNFQVGLIYMLAIFGVFVIYFPAVKTPHWPAFLSLNLAVCLLLTLFLFVSTHSVYTRHRESISLLLAILLCSVSLVATWNVKGGDVSPAGLYALYVAVTLLLYSFVPLPLYATVIIGGTYSFLFEWLLCYRLPSRASSTSSLSSTLAFNVLLHLCVHVIGVHTIITTQVRMRDTFMKVGQSLLVKKQLVNEKGLKEKMIHSVMPPKVADWLMKEGHTEEMEELQDDVDVAEEECGSMLRKVSSPRSSNQGDLRTIFRPFNMNAMENVSILFADIVGFTKMSSNKTASQLVNLLNDLFGRFDHLCTQSGCEKISTLGDCYYCVSGCPEPKIDHARNCVEMGLAMISAIQEFDEDRNESVNMRVGIHTGTVLCGIVGKRRFKFDVWSNDVTLANKMESTGKPGMVHISERTKEFLKDEYFYERGDDHSGLKTYFITGRSKIEVGLKEQQKKGFNIQRMAARRTSSTPAAIVKIDLEDGLGENNNEDEVDNKVIDPSGSVAAHSLPLLSSATNTVTTTTTTTSRSAIKRLSWKQGRRFRMTVRSASECADVHPQDKMPLGEKASLSYSSRPGLKRQENGSRKSNCTPKSGGAAIAPEAHSEVVLEFEGSGRRKYNDLLRRHSNSVPVLQEMVSTDGDARRKECGALLNFAQAFSSGSPTHASSDLNAVTTSPKALPTSPSSAESNADHHPSSPTMDADCSLNELAYRKLKADRALISCVREDASHHSYFSRPPLKTFSLSFEDFKMEEDYRRSAWRPNRFHRDHDRRAAATYVFNAYFDLFVSLLLLAVVASASLVFNVDQSSLTWIAIVIIAALYHALVTALCLRHLLVDVAKSRSRAAKLYQWARGWAPSHVLGVALLCLPLTSVFASFSCELIDSHGERDFFLQLVFISLMHFCNLSALSNLIKSSVATALALVFVLLISPIICPCREVSEDTILTQNITAMSELNDSLSSYNQEALKSTSPVPSWIKCDIWTGLYTETVLMVSMLILLVWLLNSELEVNYRLGFHCSLLASRDRKKIQSLKNQADWLLHNIIPKYVSDELKRSLSEYSENHYEVGIIFASLVNFNELYDESYMGGKEYLRVLNELISDFDELLDRNEYRNVEKIKTIGSTFMAASGINPVIRKSNSHKYQHLKELMNFVLELQRSINDFNESLIEFDLVLRVGFNHGDVTAGVIGTTKLYYDIWGDAVNIASRMDSTGVDGKVQVSEKSVEVLSEWFDFEHRGEIFVKGKDNMTTYLFTNKKASQQQQQQQQPQ